MASGAFTIGISIRICCWAAIDTNIISFVMETGGIISRFIVLSTCRLHKFRSTGMDALLHLFLAQNVPYEGMTTCQKALKNVIVNSLKQAHSKQFSSHIHIFAQCVFIFFSFLCVGFYTVSRAIPASQAHHTHTNIETKSMSTQLNAFWHSFLFSLDFFFLAVSSSVHWPGPIG